MTRGVLAVLAALVYVFLLAPFFVVALASLEGSQGLFFNFPLHRGFVFARRKPTR